MSTSVPPPTAAAPEVRSSRLLVTLAASGALAAFFIVIVYQLSLPAIEANRAARLDAAIHQVLRGIDRYETLYLQNGALTTEAPAGAAARGAERVYAGFDAAGRRVGFAIAASPAGFADNIEILFGFNPSARSMLGLVVLTSRETPGLGDKILADGWLAQFARAVAPLKAVKAGASANASDIDMITGATISSRAVINGANKAIERWSPILEAYLAGGGS